VSKKLKLAHRGMTADHETVDRRLVTVVGLVSLAGAGAAVGSVQGPDRSESPRTAFHTLVFQDNFDGGRLDTARWAPYYSRGNAGHGLRRPSAFTLDGKGNLVVTARMVNGVLVSGGMAARRYDTYGRFEFRVRTEPDPTGTTSGVVLTWPQSGNWPVDGENDMYETGNLASTRFPFDTFVHYGRSNKQYSFVHRADGAAWHTMIMDWSANAIKIYRDGQFVWSLTDRRAIPDVPHHLSIQLDALTPRALAHPVRMYVDYARIYK
jgi:beta-glucanase (GH16 family)